MQSKTIFQLPFFYIVLASLLLLWVLAAPLGEAGQTSRSYDFTLPDVHGGVFQIKDHRSQPVLLAFLSLVPDTSSTPSLRETVFLSSMSHQYEPRGLCVVAIDTSNLSRQRVSKQEVANASADWHIDFPLLYDPGGEVSRTFGVHDIPTMILLDSRGNIVRTWHGYTRPVMLAQVIESVLSGSLSKLPQLEPATR
jgi:peroxiredoxin